MNHSALYLRKQIAGAQTPAELAAHVARLRSLLVSLVDSGIRPDRVGQLIAGVGEACHLRAFELACAETGLSKESILLVFGSLARRDQSSVSDQDNGFLMPDDWVEGEDRAAKTADKMTQLLDKAGYDGSVCLMGWTGGYVLLALCLAPYLRKFGQFTVPDFFGERYYSKAARMVAVICLIIVFFYAVLGGMKGVTYTQVAQYCVLIMIQKSLKAINIC